MSAVREITSEQFDREVRSSSTPVVVDFYAPWCGPCRMLAPVLDALAQKFAGRARFVKVNVDNAPDLAGQYDVSGVPTLLIFSAGRAVERIVGFAPPQTIAARLERLVPAAAPAGVGR